jgi:endonuclease/exonuclease/phosphatase family metal-dependent hydrolase
MKFIIPSIVLSLCFTVSLFGQDLTVMSYNIRYNNLGDGHNCWDLRKDELAAQIKRYNPDIFGIQEGLHDQVLFLENYFLDFNYAGVGRDDGKTKGEYSAIFYNKNRFKQVLSKTFWLSPTPSKVSVGWDASMERICTYVILHDKKYGKNVVIFNTHFDHLGEIARLKSAELLIKFVGKIKNKNISVILMGDLNCEPESEPIKIISQKLSNAKTVSDKKNHGPNGTFNDFKQDYGQELQIDYIFVKNFKVDDYQHIGDFRINGLVYSDHFPVLAKISYLESER